MNSTAGISNRSSLDAESAGERGGNGIQEAVRLLVLAITQIEISLEETDKCAQQLSDSFESIGSGIHELHVQLESNPGLSALCLQLQENMNPAVVAAQNHDRLAQRLTQLRHGLDQLSVLLAQTQQIESTAAWRTLEKSIRAGYTMAEDRAVFDALMSGASVVQAVACYRSAVIKSQQQEANLF